MDSINLFYTTYTTIEEKNEFDLEYLGIQKWQPDTFYFIKRNGERKGSGAGMYDVTQKHYDYDFNSMLMSINPPYKLTKALDYHYSNYKAQITDEDDFLNHIEYVIFPMMLLSKRSEYIELTKKWINQNKKMMLNKHLEEKLLFLKTAYEAAIKDSPTSPLSYRMGSVEIGKSIGFDENTVLRIMQELVNDGFAETGARYIFIIVTNKGLNFLRSYENSQSQPISPNNIHIVNSPNVQIQSGAQNSHQSIINYATDEHLLRFIEELRSGKEKLKQSMKDLDFEDLEVEVDYLERSIKSNKPNKTKVQEVYKTIRGILENVTADVIASVITSGFPI